ncbi:MAG: ORF6N domain-containing protein [Bacteroidales bacterium]|nr:ORF6N domain-containing protein [Bacteroidales bacterium]
MNNLPSISQKHIESQIFTIRGVQVMIDRDLAEIYQVETKVLNQAVKRNLQRFPIQFRFQLTEHEITELVTICERFGFVNAQNTPSSSRSQNVTLNKSDSKRGLNIKYRPYAFTEQGVAMLSAVLRSEIAVHISIQIINAFVEMRKIIAAHSGLLQRIDGIERKQIETDQKFEQVFKALESKDAIPNQGVFFEGQVFDAYELASKIIRTAKKNIVLIDNYIDESTLAHLAKKNSYVKVLLLSKTVNKQLTLDVKKANEQYGNFEIQEFNKSHDRFLIIDNSEVYHIGASLKDLGKKWFAFSKLDKNSVGNILNEIGL